MLGNWSLNDYFKEESITLSHRFLTEELGVEQSKIYVTVFGGDEEVPRDDESYNIWKGLGYPDERITFNSREDNWWGPAGETGPCGPDTEIFIDTGKSDTACTVEGCGPACKCGRFVEVWNNVFMEYYKDKHGKYSKMDIHNVDTGLGLERMLGVLNGVGSGYETDLFIPIIDGLKKELCVDTIDGSNIREFRILADHIRAITFILGDDKAVTPSNVDQGYVLRRLIRRVYRHLRKFGNPEGITSKIALVVIDNYSSVYPELERNKEFILRAIEKEEKVFGRTLDQGLKIATKYLDEVEDGGILTGDKAFKLYDTFGFPIELTEELAGERGVAVDKKGFENQYQHHQELSRLGAVQKFKGGLADSSEQTAKLHTATHLLNGALRRVLGEGVHQRGSNITPERLRFDFSFDRKVTKEELDEISKIVNKAIEDKVDIVCEEMTLQEAKDKGAEGVFDNKYGDKVKVYTIGTYSKEICGGPHASNTSELRSFKIIKEESSSAGVRRIKAVIGE